MSFVKQSFLGLERTNNSSLVLRKGTRRLQISEDLEVVGRSCGEIGSPIISGNTGASHRVQFLIEEEWKLMQRIAGNISFSNQPRVVSEKDPKVKLKRETRELRRL